MLGTAHSVKWASYKSAQFVNLARKCPILEVGKSRGQFMK
jgi:hypothetical protein